MCELPHDGLQQSQYRVANPAVPVVGGTHAAAIELLDADDCWLELLAPPVDPLVPLDDVLPGPCVEPEVDPPEPTVVPEVPEVPDVPEVLEVLEPDVLVDPPASVPVIPPLAPPAPVPFETPPPEEVDPEVPLPSSALEKSLKPRTSAQPDAQTIAATNVQSDFVETRSIQKPR